MITVIAPGTTVELPRPGIKDAEVTEVHIMHDGHVTYNVVWWVNGTRNVQTVEGVEVKVPDTQVNRLTVGFVGEDD